MTQEHLFRITRAVGVTEGYIETLLADLAMDTEPPVHLSHGQIRTKIKQIGLALNDVWLEVRCEASE